MKIKIIVGSVIFLFIAMIVYVYISLVLPVSCFTHKIETSSSMKVPLDSKKSPAAGKDLKSGSQEEKKEATPAAASPTQPAAAAKPEFGSSNIINILFLGIDRTEERDKTLGIYRADTICVIRVNLDSKKARVLCIPRDTYAFIPDKNKMDKINHSYAYGSIKNKAAEYTVNSVNNFIKYSKIDYYFAIDMEPVPEIVDALGGVQLDVEIDMKTHGADISKGLQVLDGKKAYQYIRWRYSGNGDIDRIKRQQKFARAVLKQLKTSGGVTECVKLIWKYGRNIKTNLTLTQVISLAIIASEIKGDNIGYSLVPGNGEYINRISYWIPDKEETDKILKDFFEK